MKIISWNCNSSNVRYEQIKNILNEYKPDILMLQETRSKTIKDIDGYNIYHNPAINGRNGVAIISPHFLQIIHTDNNGRLIHALHKNINVLCVYVPNGCSIFSPVEEKIKFFQDISHFYSQNNVIIGGDFNVLYKSSEFTIPHPYTLIEQKQLIQLENYLEYKTVESTFITWWNYQNNALRRNEGYGIDKIYNSRNLTTKPIEVLHHYRRKIQPSDHAPIYTEVINVRE